MFNGISLVERQHGFGIRYSGTVVPYLHFLEQGTKPHLIRPREKKALRFNAGGSEIFAKLVRHPGSTKHKGFIKVKTVDAILGLINSKRNGTFNDKQFAQTYNDVRKREYTSRTNETLMRAIGSVR